MKVHAKSWLASLIPIAVLGLSFGTGPHPGCRSSDSPASPLRFDCFLMPELPLLIHPYPGSKECEAVTNQGEAIWSIEVSEIKDDWLNVVAKKELETRTGWIQGKRQLGVYSRNYSDTLFVYANPIGGKMNYSSAEFMNAPMLVLEVSKERMRVEFAWNGENITGWVDWASLCGNPYSTCP